MCALLWVRPLGSKNHATNVKTNTVVSDDSRELRLLTVSVVVRFFVHDNYVYEKPYENTTPIASSRFFDI